MNSKRIDIGVGSALSLFSVIVFLYADQYSMERLSQYGPDFFPKALAVIMLCFSVKLIVDASVRGKFQKDMETIDRKGFIRSAITLGIAIVYLLTMQLLGFLISTILFLYVLMTYIGHKGKLVRLLASVGVSLVVFGIFVLFLKIPLPEGIFFNLF